MEKILVLDFGGQYAQLIARRVREKHVYSELRPYRTPLSEIVAAGYKGIIFTGGPNSVYDPASPHCDPAILQLGIPILGICYGHQLLAYLAGGTVSHADNGGEYGKTEVAFGNCVLFDGLPRTSVTWMSHTDSVSVLPDGFRAAAATDKCPVAAMCDDDRRLYGVQFHPEVTHTEYGSRMLSAFLFKVCGCAGDWSMDDFIERTVETYRRELAGKKVLLALSGGVDSSVAAALMARAVGDSLYCVFVDHGFLRLGEPDLIERTFRDSFGLNFIRADAREEFLAALRGVTEPEQKRRIVGAEFLRVFEREAKALGKLDVFVQGTIYPDVIESGLGASAVIKSHHNVGGLPSRIGFERLVEPLRALFKDEVRAVGTALGLPREIVSRQPFPGPGLSVRIIGEVTEEKLELLRRADAIFREEIDNAGMPELPSQYFAVLTDTKTVGVKGDARSYGNVIALRAVRTDDFMTAEWSHIPWDALERAASRITAELPPIPRVVYDITSKPPATVEWE